MVWPLSKKSRKVMICFEVFPDKRVCKYCKKEFSCGRALGGHMKSHSSKETKFCPTKCHRRSSSFPPCSNTNSYCKKEVGSEIDLSKFLLSGWKVHKRRGPIEGKRDKSYRTTDDKVEAHDAEGKEIEAAEEEDDQEEETDNAQDSDSDDIDFSMIESLKAYRLSGFTHEISRSTNRSRYVCLTCSIVFPTFHAVRCHIHGSVSSSANAEQEE